MRPIVSFFRRPRDLGAAVRALGIVTASFAIGACVWVMLGRIAYPFDLEWMTGSELDHIERVRAGLPLYVPPSSDWIPFLYPPLYYEVCANVAGILHDARTSARLVSIAATGVQAYAVWRASRALGASRSWAYLALGSFFAAFPFVEYWYDIERPDSLFTALLLVALLVSIESASVWSAGIAGIVLGVAFFVKQPALLFATALVVAHLVDRKWKQAIAMALPAFAIIFGGIRSFDASTSGWFSYYVIRMPRAHGITPSLFWDLATDLGHAWLFTSATFCVFIWFLARFRIDSRSRSLPVAFLAAGFVSSGASRMHVGGWPNVLMFWTAGASIAIGVVGSAIEARLASTGEHEHDVRRWIARALPILFVVQAVELRYAPWDHVPKFSDPAWPGFEAHVRDLEKNGEVLAVGVGHLTSKRHYHDAAFFDLLYVEKRVPEPILNDVRSQRFAAIVIDNFDDLWLPYEPAIGDSFMRVVASHYYVGERVDEALPSCILGFQVHPSWILFPRAEPLREDSPIEELVRRQTAEVATTEERAHALGRGVRFTGNLRSAENRAARVEHVLYEDAVDGGAN
jgi:hypothetical protein